MTNFRWPILDDQLFASIGKAFFVVALLLAFLVFPIFKGKLLRLPPQQVESQSVTSNAATNPSPDQAEGDNSIPTDAGAKNKDTKIESPRDIAAQEGMWGAAVALVLLTIGQIFVGLITLGLVYNTFKVQSDELDATKETNALQLRPWFKLGIRSKSPSAIKYPVSFDDIPITYKVTIKNIGATPANQARIIIDSYTGKFNLLGGYPDGPVHFWFGSEEFRYEKFNVDTPILISPNEKVEHEFIISLIIDPETQRKHMSNSPEHAQWPPIGTALDLLDEDKRFVYRIQGRIIYGEFIGTGKAEKRNVCTFEMGRDHRSLGQDRDFLSDEYIRVMSYETVDISDPKAQYERYNPAD